MNSSVILLLFSNLATYFLRVDLSLPTCIKHIGNWSSSITHVHWTCICDTDSEYFIV